MYSVCVVRIAPQSDGFSNKNPSHRCGIPESPPSASKTILVLLLHLEADQN